MGYLVCGKIRKDKYDAEVAPAVTVVAEASSEDEAKEMARQHLLMDTGYLVTIDQVHCLKKPNTGEVDMDFDAPWHEQTLVAFDTETTGLNPKGSEIVEFGFAVREEEDFNDEVISFFVGDAETMPKEAQKINGISDDMFADEPPLAEIFDEKLRPILEKADALIAHNSSFDVSFLLHRMREDGLEAQIPPIFCTKEMAEIHGKFSDAKLQTVREHYGIDPGQAHRAGDDARVCGQVFLEMAREMEYFHPPCSMRDAIEFFDQVTWDCDPPMLYTS